MSYDSNPDNHEADDDRLRPLLLLTLPFLTYQRLILEIAKSAVLDAQNRRPTERFLCTELQALKMILGSSRSFRDRFGEDFEVKAEAAIKEISSRIHSASLELIDAHDSILARVFDALDTARKADKAKKASQAAD